MTRLEAVIENLESMENEFKSNNFIEESPESKALILEASKLSTLTDISVTLAMIADALYKEVSDGSNNSR